MIYSIKGVVTRMEPNLAVLETGGVGFGCKTSAHTLSALSVGTEATLLTHMNVREDAIELFGFGESSELTAFRLLLTVSGVGPKAALSVLSDLTPQGFAMCVVAGDYKLLQKAPGIGQKTAQRIVLELRDKLAKDSGGQFAKSGGGIAGSGNIAVTGGNTQNEALSALCVLGFSPGQASAALEGVDTALSSSEQIKAALQKLGSRK